MEQKGQFEPSIERFLQLRLDEASAGFEQTCKQARRGLRVSMAVKVFGVGTLLPNDLSDASRVGG